MATASVPERERPTIPDGYGLPSTADGLLSWDAVEQRLRASRHYWLATVRPDGTPHSVPRWGVWLDGCFYYDGAAATRHVRNLDHNPACTLTLESGTEVVIIEGLSTATPHDATPFDMRGAELSHHGEDCTFETILVRYALDDPVLHVIAALVHEVYAPAALGLDLVTRGVSLVCDDAEALRVGARIFDGLYEQSRQQLLRGSPAT